MDAEAACTSEDLNELKSQKVATVRVEKAPVYLLNKQHGLWDHLACSVLPLHL